MKKRLLTGIQSSGDLHIGNYFGALKPFLDTYKEYESFLMVADYHALTSNKNGAEIRRNIFNVVRDYLAVGVDPSAAVIFKQSDVPEHTELAWIFNCLVSVPFLMQAHSYKDKIAKGLEANAGLFTYPMLQAADIALYNTHVVPVGEDQRQHIEYAREVVAKFNSTYGATLVEPKELILKGVGVVPGTDGTKMSKSYKNTIPLFGTKDDIAEAVMSIVTDSSLDVPQNVYAIHTLYRSEHELQPLYEAHKGKYKQLKEALIEDIESHIAPLRATRDAITDEEVKMVLEQGREQAHAVAEETMREIRMKVGVQL